MTETGQIDIYLSRLRSQLSFLSVEEREEIVREIGAHIRDSVDGSGAGVEAVLAGLGSAAELAAGYREGAWIRRASRSFSPLLLLRAGLRFATTGILGTVVFLCGFCGYAIGGGLVATGLLKPLLPGHTGLWTENGRVVASGVQAYLPPAAWHEVLGWWYIPLAMAAGGVLLAVTTLLMRVCLRGARKWRGGFPSRPVTRERVVSLR